MITNFNEFSNFLNESADDDLYKEFITSIKKNDFDSAAYTFTIARDHEDKSWEKIQSYRDKLSTEQSKKFIKALKDNDEDLDPAGGHGLSSHE